MWLLLSKLIGQAVDGWKIDARKFQANCDPALCDAHKTAPNVDFPVTTRSTHASAEPNENLHRVWGR